jgi:imidazolonepropionase
LSTWWTGSVESIAFNPAQIARVFDVAVELGLPVKLHAEQLSDQGGAALAARYGAKSVEHLEYVSDEDVRALAQAGSVAVMLPGAFYFLKEIQKPPIDSFRRSGVPLAVSTDSNPGSSPMTSLLLAMNMAATLFGLTPEEALRGVTVNAARALGQDRLGRLAAGCLADFAVWDVTDPAELTYRMGDAPLHARYLGGDAVLTPGSVTLNTLEHIWRKGGEIRLDPAARDGVRRSARQVEAAARGSEAVYGVNTGFRQARLHPHCA